MKVLLFLASLVGTLAFVPSVSRSTITPWRNPLAIDNRYVQQCVGNARCGGLKMSDYQENTEGLEVGDMVKVVAKGLKFFHLRAFKDGFDPEGGEGEVTAIKLYSEEFDCELTPNRPVMVAFSEPTKYIAHFEFDEVKKI